MERKSLKAKLCTKAIALAMVFVSLGLVAAPAAATDVSDSVDTINNLLPTIVELMVIMLIISLLTGLFAGIYVGKRR